MSDKKISGIRALRDKLTTKAVSCAELTQAISTPSRGTMDDSTPMSASRRTRLWRPPAGWMKKSPEARLWPPWRASP